MKSTRLVFAAVPMLVMVHGVFAAELTSDAVKRCAAMTDSLARLVCYDQLASGTAATTSSAAAPAVAAPPAPAPAPAPVVAPAAAAAASGATTTAPSRPPQIGDDSVKGAGEPKAAVPTSLIAQVTALQTVRGNTYYVSLDNGQAWLQEEMHTGFLLKVGDTVQIERGKMGGYKLAYAKDGKPTGAWVRVTRKK